MDQQPIDLYHDQRPVGEPIQKFDTVGRVQDRRKRIAVMRLRMSGGHREQMEIVIAQDRNGGVAKRFDLAQHRERFGTTIDEVAD